MISEEIIRKYNVPVPRYTSYPTANAFESFSNERYLRMVDESNDAPCNQLSFYIHVPFCRHLCHYCGCNSQAMAGEDGMEAYFSALHKEIDILLPHIRKDRKISQIHYGGGSPSSVPLRHIKAINDRLLSAFDMIERPEIAIECHPGYLRQADWEFLVQCGFTRYSLGIQDFDNQVLHAVNRRPPLLPVEDILEILRQDGASVNFDFIYGLPGQTADSFSRTIERAVRYCPDRLVTFGYAHVPWLYRRQAVLEKAGLPAHDEKLRMFERAGRLLTSAGYCRIGMDHFVLPDDDLQQALENRQLHRNFQGYCHRRITAQVYALGVSGISQLDGAYAQNTKSVEKYVGNLMKGKLCIEKGYALADWQRVAREVIECLMCNYRMRWQDMADRLHLTVPEVKKAMNEDEGRLREMASDGLITFDDEHIAVTEEGSPFVRNVAAALDRMMTDTNRKFSKPI